MIATTRRSIAASVALHVATSWAVIPAGALAGVLFLGVLR